MLFFLKAPVYNAVEIPHFYPSRTLNQLNHLEYSLTAGVSSSPFTHVRQCLKTEESGARDFSQLTEC